MTVQDTTSKSSVVKTTKKPPTQLLSRGKAKFECKKNCGHAPFKTEHGLNIHMGAMHMGRRSSPAAKKARKLAKQNALLESIERKYNGAKISITAERLLAIQKMWTKRASQEQDSVASEAIIECLLDLSREFIR